MAKKQKKITVKHFLNTQLKGKMGDDGKKRYPVYVKVTYDRRNFNYKSRVVFDRENTDLTEDEFNDIYTCRTDYEKEIQVIKKVIQYLIINDFYINSKALLLSYDFFTRDIVKDIRTYFFGYDDKVSVAISMKRNRDDPEDEWYFLFISRKTRIMLKDTYLEEYIEVLQKSDLDAEKYLDLSDEFKCKVSTDIILLEAFVKSNFFYPFISRANWLDKKQFFIKALDLHFNKITAKRILQLIEIVINDHSTLLANLLGDEAQLDYRNKEENL